MPVLFTKEGLEKRGFITSGYHIPYNPALKERARKLRKNMTKAERKIWYECLKKLNVNILRQKPIDNYIADFYIPSAQLVIEIDGGNHSADHFKKFDEHRTKIMEAYGLQVVRYKNDDVLNNIEMIYSDLKRRIQSWKADL